MRFAGERLFQKIKRIECDNVADTFGGGSLSEFSDSFLLYRPLRKCFGFFLLCEPNPIMYSMSLDDLCEGCFDMCGERNGKLVCY